jgi:hypothetical protein
VAGNLESLDPASMVEAPWELVLLRPNRTADAQSLEGRQALLPVPAELWKQPQDLLHQSNEAACGLLRSRRYKCNAGRRRQKRNRSRVNNLEDKSTGRGPSVTAPGKPRASSFAVEGNPSWKEVVLLQSQKRRYSSWRSCSERNRRDAVFERSVRHFSDVSYEAERSALMMIDWSLRLAASSNGPSCSMVTRWSWK